MSIHSVRAGALIAILAAGVACAQSPASADPVLVENASVSVRKSDFDLELERLPADIRPGFATNERRVNELLRRMLIERTLAAQARTEKLDQAPSNAKRLATEIEKLYAQLKLAQIEDAAAAEFDANRSKWELRARELYTVDRKKYETPEQLQASHILFDIKTRSSDDAKKMATEARARIVAGGDMNQLAREVSDDRSARTNNGRLDWFARAEMDPAFANAAFALKSPGDISEPVQSSFGWHVVRLDARRPAVQRSFEDVRDIILNEAKQKQVNDAREAWIAKLRNDSSIRANREAIDALVVRTDASQLRRQQESGPGGAPPR
ncbi:MAG TPA: peptidylprolyl isomerase [Casimicrobiaceae bacterium]|nr:peptidylprolyl isomerase [Casimicrobiaceae bacterium]